MFILGLETSCDETACGIVGEGLKLFSNRVFSQISTHAAYGGVVPEIAARAHLEKVGFMVAEALAEAGISLETIDRVGYTRGPGLVGALLVGATYAQGLAYALGKPSIGLHHLEGHLGAAYLENPKLTPPFIILVASGGHTELLLALPGFRYRLLGCTRDDAAGEAFDKTGKLLGLGYPAGPMVARLAEGGRRNAFHFPRALLDRPDNYEFSFSGLKTAVQRQIHLLGPEKSKAQMADICASVQAAIVDVLVKRTVSAVQAFAVNAVAVVGGVAANVELRSQLNQVGQREGFECVFPRPAFCGDNGAMMAAIAYKRAEQGIWPENQKVMANLPWDGLL